MPELCRFLGIIINMYYLENEAAHFHAKYGEYRIQVFIESGIINGEFPKRALKLVLEWYELHKQELIDNWELSQLGEPLKKIKPLE